MAKGNGGKPAKLSYYVGRPSADWLDSNGDKGRPRAPMPLWRRQQFHGLIYFAVLVPAILFGVYHWSWSTTINAWDAEARSLSQTVRGQLDQTINRGHQALALVADNLAMNADGRAGLNKSFLGDTAELAGLAQIEVTVITNEGQAPQPATSPLSIKTQIDLGNSGRFHLRGDVDAGAFEQAMPGAQAEIWVVDQSGVIVLDNHQEFLGNQPGLQGPTVLSLCVMGLNTPRPEGSYTIRFQSLEAMTDGVMEMKLDAPKVAGDHPLSHINFLMVKGPLIDGYRVVVLTDEQNLSKGPIIQSLLATFALTLAFVALFAAMQLQANRRMREESRQRYTRKLQAREAESRAIIESAFMGVITVDDQGRIESANPTALDLFEYDIDDLLLETSAMLFSAQDQDIWQDVTSQVQGAVQSRRTRYNGEVQGRRKSGQLFPAHLMGTVITVDKQPKLLLAFKDLTQDKRDQEQLMIAAAIVEHAAEGILVTDAQTNILSVNPALTKITGYSERELIGNRTALLSSGRHDEEFYRVMWGSLHAQGTWSGEIWNRRKDGSTFPEQLSISAIRNKAEEVTHYVAVVSDITLRKQFEEELTFLAHHDPLTGLPNRASLVESITTAMARAKRRNRQIAVMFLDLDGFKAVNDGLGHAVGDELLIEISKRLVDCLRDEDITSRLGGDEFVLLLNESGGLGEIRIIAERIIEAVSSPYEFHGETCSVSASVGIAVYPGDGEDAEALLKAADNAMYQVKSEGKNAYRFSGNGDTKAQTG